MALKQTRRSISVRGTTYDKLRQYGETHDRSMSDIVEELLATILESQPVVAAPKPVAPPPLREKSASRLRFNPPPMAKPRPSTLANRVVRAVPPPVPPRPSNKPVLPGRPAPTPAAQVIKVREEKFEKDDYRAIRF